MSDRITIIPTAVPQSQRNEAFEAALARLNDIESAALQIAEDSVALSERATSIAREAERMRAALAELNSHTATIAAHDAETVYE